MSCKTTEYSKIKNGKFLKENLNQGYIGVGWDENGSKLRITEPPPNLTVLLLYLYIQSKSK